MKTEWEKGVLTWFFPGLLVGFLLAQTFHGFEAEPYSIQTMSIGRVAAIKLNKKTGQTWLLKNDGTWATSPPKGDIFDEVSQQPASSRPVIAPDAEVSRTNGR
jgi:hypothetical protein